jgi:hypothetical protein
MTALAVRTGIAHVCTRCRCSIPAGRAAYLTTTGYRCPPCHNSPEHD